MGLLTLNLPVVGQASATEDQKVRDGLASIQTLLNGNVDEANAPNLSAAFTAYKTILAGGALFNGNGAATFILNTGPTTVASSSAPLVGGANSASMAFRFDPADFAANARVTKLRLRANAFVNAVAPTSTWTLGMYPVATWGGAAGAAPTVATLGTVITGSTAAITTPAASAQTTVSSGDFNAPAAGYYVIAAVLGSLMVVNSQVLISCDLQVRQV